MTRADRRSFFKTRSPFVNRPALCGRAAIVPRMVDDMRGLEAVTGSATRDDLLSLGWTGRQLDQHGAAARETAAAAASREIGRRA